MPAPFCSLIFRSKEAIMVNPGFDAETVAQQAGGEGVDKLVTDAERICIYEQQRIARTNEAEIVRFEAEFAILHAEQRRIAGKLEQAPPSGNLLRLRLKAIFYWVVVVILLVTGFFSTMLSFAPFRLGWMSWLVSAGLAMLTPFLVDRLLENPGMGTAIKVLTGIAAAASLACLMLLALIRGNLLAQQIRESEASAVVIDDTQPEPATSNNFYDRATGLLSVALLLMAFVTETGGGLALHAAWRSMPDSSEDWTTLRRELIEIRGRMAAIASHVTMLRNEPDIFAARFWRDFYRALLLNATRSAMTKLLVVFLALFAFAAQRSHAEDRLNLVIAIDLTRSVAARGPDGKTDFQKNVEGVSRVLAQVPAGTRLTVVGITDHSFTDPYILMSARVPDDPGYFGGRLNAARGQIVRAWKQRSAPLNPDFKQTDIFGALELASQLLAEQPRATRKELVIFSDMRESMPGLDLEDAKLVPAFSAIANRCGEPPALRGVQVYVAGADGAGKSTAFWQSLRKFWVEYFQNGGADFEGFTVLREVSLGNESTPQPSCR
jgi:hypothetical protein